MESQVSEVASVAIISIRVGNRKRPIDENSVREIAQSIEQQGLFQPIGIKPCGGHLAPHETVIWDLVFGAHRLAAYKLLERDNIEAHILSSDLTEDEYLLIELQENYTRKDLTRDQRKTFAGEINKIFDKMRASGQSDIVTKNWLADLSKTTGIIERTLRRWWDTFCEETDRKMTPREALQQDCAAFSAWLIAKQEEEIAEKRRKEEEEAAKRRLQDLSDALENLYTLATDYGRETVITEVIDIFLANEELHAPDHDG
jgi:ParB/RepB/Spo0J family partition protein